MADIDTSLARLITTPIAPSGPYRVSKTTVFAKFGSSIRGLAIEEGPPGPASPWPVDRPGPRRVPRQRGPASSRPRTRRRASCVSMVPRFSPDGSAGTMRPSLDRRRRRLAEVPTERAPLDRPGGSGPGRDRSKRIASPGPGSGRLAGGPRWSDASHRRSGRSRSPAVLP